MINRPRARSTARLLGGKKGGSSGMSDKAPAPEDRTLTDDEREAERRFQETLGRLVNTPHKPHKDEPPKPRKRA